MISVIGSRKPKPGFTMAEMLLVLGLIGLVVGVFALNFDLLITRFSEKPAQKQLYDLVRDVRIACQRAGVVCALRFEPESKALILVDYFQNSLKEYATVGIERIWFEEKQPLVRQGKEWIAGAVVPVLEQSKPLLFHPDGTSAPVIVHILAESGETLELDLDLFSANVQWPAT